MKELRGSPPQGEERLYWALLSMVPGVGPVRFERMLAAHGGEAGRAWNMTLAAAAGAGLDQKSARALLNLRSSISPQALESRLQRLQVRILTILDDDYPSRLVNIADPPPVLFVRGGLKDADTRAVALVGTRRASAYGRMVAEALARDLALAGVTVISGLAKGVDAVAHRAAVEAGGRTLAILGSGLDQIYPPENKELARRIVEGERGALVTEFGPGVPPDAVNFPRRNRIISGLCAGTVIIEAGMKSGALITADFALEQGREVLAVPGNISSPLSIGPNTLLKQGATPVLDAGDILDALGMNVPSSRSDESLPLLDGEEARVFKLLGGEPRHVDGLARELDCGVGDVSGILALLEIKGVARQVGGMAYIRSL